MCGGCLWGAPSIKIGKSTLRDKRAQAMPNVYHSSHHVPHTMAGQAGEDVEVLSGRTTSYEEATAEGGGAPAPDTTIDLSGKDRKKVCVLVFVFACLCGCVHVRYLSPPHPRTCTHATNNVRVSESARVCVCHEAVVGTGCMGRGGSRPDRVVQVSDHVGVSE